MRLFYRLGRLEPFGHTFNAYQVGSACQETLQKSCLWRNSFFHVSVLWRLGDITSWPILTVSSPHASHRALPLFATSFFPSIFLLSLQDFLLHLWPKHSPLSNYVGQILCAAAISKTIPLLCLSNHDTLSIRLKNRNSKNFNFFSIFLLIVHVSQIYKWTDHSSDLHTLFLGSNFTFLSKD